MAKARTPRNDNDSPNPQVITMPDASSGAAVRRNISAASASPVDLEAQIRVRAYQLYEERGCAPGHETDDWFRAEREIRTRSSRQQSA